MSNNQNTLERTKIYVGSNLFGFDKCEKCGSLLSGRDQRVVFDSFNTYHYNCFEPNFKQFILENDVKYFIEGQIKENFKIWLENWNKNYPPVGISTFQYKKHIKSSKPKFFRIWVEILKFLTPNELGKLSSVSKDFYYLSWEDEIWISILNQNKSNITGWRNKYLIENKCYECNRIMNDWEYFCPLLQRNICGSCRFWNKKYELYDENDISNIFGINSRFLNIKLGYGSNNNRLTYRFLIEKAILKFRKRNKEKILEKYKAWVHFREIKEILDIIDIHSSFDPKVNNCKIKNNHYASRLKEIADYIYYRKGDEHFLNSLYNIIS